MRLKLLFIAIILTAASACAPQVLCPAYTMDDTIDEQPTTEQQASM